MAIDIVTTNADSGTGSLRDTLANAAQGDTISFDPTFFNSATNDDIKLASTLTISKNVTILGLQAGGTTRASITIDGQKQVGDFTIDSGVTANLDGLRIVNGFGTSQA